MKVFSRYIIAFTSFLIGLIGDHAHRSSVHPREPHNNVPGIIGHYLKEVTLINNQSNYIQDVVWLVGRMRNDVIETRNHTIPMCVHVGVMCVYMSMCVYVCMCLNVYKHAQVIDNRHILLVTTFFSPYFGSSVYLCGTGSLLLIGRKSMSSLILHR